MFLGELGKRFSEWQSRLEVIRIAGRLHVNRWSGNAFECGLEFDKLEKQQHPQLSEIKITYELFNQRYLFDINGHYQGKQSSYWRELVEVKDLITGRNIRVPMFLGDLRSYKEFLDEQKKKAA